MFVWNGARTAKFRFKLKIKQKKCSNLFLKRKDVLRLLPAGFGKSLIYQLFPTVGVRAHALVDSALKAISDEKIEELNGLGICV